MSSEIQERIKVASGADTTDARDKDEEPGYSTLITVSWGLGIMGGFLLGIGILMFFIVPTSIPGFILLGISALWLVPALICLSIGLIWRGRERPYMELASLLKAHRRIKVSELARKMAVTEFQVEIRIARCIEKGYVKGHFDRHNGEFFTGESLEQVVSSISCPRCKAPLDTTALVGEQMNCPFCGSQVTASADH